MRNSDGPQPDEGQILVVGENYRPQDDAWADYQIQIRRHNSLSGTSNDQGFTTHTKYESDGKGLDFWTAYWAKKYVERHGYEEADIETVNLEKVEEKDGETDE